MTITQTVDIPENRRLVIDVPSEVLPGKTILTFTPAPAIAETPPRRSRAEAVEYCTSLFKRLGVDLSVDTFLDKSIQGRDFDALLDLMQAAEEQGDCPICAAYRDPVTGDPRYKIAPAAEGEIASKRFHSFNEMWEDLMRDDPDDD